MTDSTKTSKALAAIDYGERFRIGMIIPSANVIAEPQIHAMSPCGVAVHFTRLPLRGSSVADLLGMAENVESAASLLADAKVDLIAFNCTAVSTFSLQLEIDIHDRIERATGVPAVTTGQALTAALTVLDRRKIMLLTPYTDDINDRETAFLREKGVHVVASAGLALNTPGEMAALPSQVWLELARQHRTPDADACLISCTAVRSAEVIDELEQDLGYPVITSNQALIWHCLRSKGIRDSVNGFGSLLACY